MKLKQHRIVITGAGRGIGAAMARRLAAEGAGVALLARTASEIDAVAAGIAASGGRALAIPCDVADDASVVAAAQRIRKELGPVTALVNNAGIIGPIGHLGDTDPSEWMANIDVNLGGAFRMTRVLIADLLAAEAGVIVNVSSGAASRPLEGWSAYCTAKAGLAMMTRALNHEYGAAGLAVYGLRPGLVDTAMQAEIREAGIGPIAALPRTELMPPDNPAHLAAWLIGERPAEWRGDELDIRDPAVRQAAGLVSSGQEDDPAEVREG